MKVSLNSSGYMYSQYQMEQFSWSKFSQNQGMETSSGLLENIFFHSSMTNEPAGMAANGSFSLTGLGSASAAGASSFFSAFLGCSFLGACSFFLLSPEAFISANFLASNCAILSASFGVPDTPTTAGWFMMVVYHLTQFP